MNPIIDSLKARYFDVIRTEDYPHTPKITKELDNIEAAVREIEAREKADVSTISN